MKLKLIGRFDKRVFPTNAYVNSKKEFSYHCLRISDEPIGKEEFIRHVKRIYRFYDWKTVYKNNSDMYNICDDVRNWISSVERDYKINKTLNEIN